MIETTSIQSIRARPCAVAGKPLVSYFEFMALWAQLPCQRTRLDYGHSSKWSNAFRCILQKIRINNKVRAKPDRVL